MFSTCDIGSTECSQVNGSAQGGFPFIVRKLNRHWGQNTSNSAGDRGSHPGARTLAFASAEVVAPTRALVEAFPSRHVGHLHEHGNTPEGGGERVVRPVILGPNDRDFLPLLAHARMP